MMINHSTLEYHVTNFNTFLRWLWRKNQNPNTFYSDPNHNPNHNHDPNHNQNPCIQDTLSSRARLA